MERGALQRVGIRVPALHEDDLEAIDERAGLGELRTALGVELARLSVEQREALRLRVVEERSYAEVALVLGVSERRSEPGCRAACVRSRERLSHTELRSFPGERSAVSQGARGGV